MLKHLFSKNGTPYKLSKKNEQEIFKLLDENQVNVEPLTTQFTAQGHFCSKLSLSWGV